VSRWLLPVLVLMSVLAAPPARAAEAVDAAQAYRAAVAGEAVLIDIRTPDEWAATGVPAPAVTADALADGFLDRVMDLVDWDRARPIILICAAGVRSEHASGVLRAAGFTAVGHVPEGVVGSEAGPGWLARGLPVEQIGDRRERMDGRGDVDP